MTQRVHNFVALVLAATAVLTVVVVAMRNGDPQVEPPPTKGNPMETQAVERASLDSATRNSPRIEPSEEAANLAPPSNGWDALYRTSDNYSFVRSAAPAAVAGDGRAAWLVSLAFRDCRLFVLGRAGSDPSLRASLAVPAPPAALVERCRGFLTSDPLDGFDLPQEARRSDYWQALAVEAGDGRAVMYKAASIAASLDGQADAETRNKQYGEIVDGVRIAAASKDPEAIAAIGSLFMLPSVAKDPLQGAAWVLASCELGTECSQVPTWAGDCASAGTCDASTFAEQLQRSVDAQVFAQLYAKAQDIAYKIRTEDWDGLTPYLQTRR